MGDLQAAAVCEAHLGSGCLHDRAQDAGKDLLAPHARLANPQEHAAEGRKVDPFGDAAVHAMRVLLKSFALFGSEQACSAEWRLMAEAPCLCSNCFHT